MQGGLLGDNEFFLPNILDIEKMFLPLHSVRGNPNSVNSFSYWSDGRVA